MSRVYLGFLGLVLIFVSGAGDANGQDKIERKAKTGDAPKSIRLAYFVKHGSAKELAGVLAKYLKGDAEVQLIPDSLGNGLLINADGALLDEVVKLLGQLDRRSPTGSVSRRRNDLRPLYASLS